MSLANLLKEAGGTQSNQGGLQGLMKEASGISDYTRSTQREAEAARFESDAQNSFGSIVKNTAKDLGSRLINIIPNAIKGTKAQWDTSAQGIKDAIVQGSDEYSTVLRGEDPTLRSTFSLAKAGGRVAGDFATAVFAPLSAAIGSVLEASGGQALIDKAGQTIADSSGITDWEAFQKFAMEHPNAGTDFNRLVTLATLGEAGKGKVNLDTLPARLVEQSKKVAREVVNTRSMLKGAEAVRTAQEQGLRKLVVEGQGPGMRRVPLTRPEGPTSIFDPEYARRQGYEGYTPESELPSIPFGARGRSTPGIQMEAPGRRVPPPPGMRYEAIPEPQMVRSPMQVDEVLGNKRPTEAPTQVPIGVTRAEALPGNKQSKVGLSVQAKAIEDGLIKTFEDTALYDSRTVADQSNKIAALMENPERVKRIVRGDETLPPGYSGSMFIKGVEEFARKTKDPALLRDLASSPLASETSIHASEMRFLAERNPESALVKIKEVQKARQEGKNMKDVPKAKRETVIELKKELHKTRPTKQNWEDFIKSIQC